MRSPAAANGRANRKDIQHRKHSENHQSPQARGKMSLEVEVAADAIRALDQEAAGRGVSYLAMAIVALEAAAKVRGKTAVHLEGDRLQ